MIHQSAIIGFVFAVMGMVSARANGETIWQWTHDASGSGSANVFDGGPVLTSEAATTGPDDTSMSFLASDFTVGGSSGATARAGGSSRVFVDDEQNLHLDVRFDASYIPSFNPGGDNPGGTAEGELFSVIEFVMPTDELTWFYDLRIDDSEGFSGATRVIFENVTQGEAILDLQSEVFPTIETTLYANAGDVMRFTTQMSGSGETGPAPIRSYRPRFRSVFVIPEPGMNLPVLMAMFYLLRRKR